MENPYRRLLSWGGLASIAVFQVWLTVNYKDVANARTWLVWVALMLVPSLVFCILGAVRPGLIADIWQGRKARYVMAVLVVPYLGVCALGVIDPKLLALIWQWCKAQWVTAVVVLLFIGLCIPLRRCLCEFSDVRTELRSLRRDFERMQDVQPFGIKCSLLLSSLDLKKNEDVATCVHLLGNPVLKTVKGLTEEGAQVAEVTDSDIARLLQAISEPYMSKIEQLLTPIHKLRETAYGLGERFPLARQVLQMSVEAQLGNPGDEVGAVHVKAYDEVVGHADRWSIQDLSEKLCPRLREVGSSPPFAEMHRSENNVPVRFGSRIVDPTQKRKSTGTKEHHRVWKRIKGQDGTVKCLVKSTGEWCKEGKLENVSLCGCYCSNCKLEEAASVEKVKIDLTANGALWSFAFRGRFRPHSNHFRGDGQRSVHNGFGIQLLELEDPDDGGRHDDWANIIAQGQEA